MECTDWQTNLLGIVERTKYAFEKSLFCDVEFTVNSSSGCQETLQANKYILAISSPVFAAMFYGELAEKASSIHIEDCTKEGLYRMLQFVHSDEVSLTVSNVLEVLYVADKYIMPSLVDKCKAYIKKELKPEETLIILPQLPFFRDEELEKHCWNLIDKEAKRTVFSYPFLDLTQEMLCEILKRDTLKINELDMFQAIDHWASTKLEEIGLEINGKNKRSVLGEDLIRLIRFPIMKTRHFVEFVLPCEILKKQELTELLHYFYYVTKSTTMFIAKHRIEEFTSPCRFCTVEDPRDESSDSSATPGQRRCNSYSLSFRLNKCALLVGVKMFGNIRLGTTFFVELDVSEENEADVLSHVASSFTTDNQSTDDEYYEFTVSLPEPLRLDQDISYKISAIAEGPPTYRGKHAKSMVTVEDPDEDSFTIKFLGSGFIKHQQFPAFVFRLTDD